ncbi:MAG: foldase protein PrsA [Candidatus Zipacnadales bacterium]
MNHYSNGLVGPVVFVLVTTLALGGCERKHVSAPPHIVAEVNSVAISRGEFMRVLERSHGPLALRDLVDRAIIAQMAEKQGIKVAPERVDYLLEQEEMRAGGRSRLERELAKKGQTLEDLRTKLTSDALADELIASQIEVPEVEVRAYYQEHKADFRHGEMIKGRLILCTTRANAEAIHSVLNDPQADFAGLAKALSCDPATKEEGGDMGWIERGDYAREITDAAFKLQPGQYSDIIEYADGFAIVLVEARKPAGYKGFDEVRPAIESLLRREKEAALRPAWAAQQRKQAQIQVYDRRLRERFDLIKDQ